jgi:hypothetical protein
MLFWFCKFPAILDTRTRRTTFENSNSVEAMFKLEIDELIREKLIEVHRFKTIFSHKGDSLNDGFFRNVIWRGVVQMG